MIPLACELKLASSKMELMAATIDTTWTAVSGSFIEHARSKRHENITELNESKLNVILRHHFLPIAGLLQTFVKKQLS